MKKSAVDGGAAAPDGCTRGALRANGSWDEKALWNPAWTPDEMRASRYPRRRMAFFAMLLRHRRGTSCSPAEMAARIDVECTTWRPGYDGDKNPAEMFPCVHSCWARLERFDDWPVARGTTSAEQMLIHEGYGSQDREWRGGRWAKRDAAPAQQPGPELGDDPW